MYQYKGIKDTIAAVATPSGEGGIAIVRLSGDDTFLILSKIFQSSAANVTEDWPGFTARHGWVVDPDTSERIDEVVVTRMRSPKSYTCEDMIEIGCHGGSLIVRDVLLLCVRQGARLAQPGEFTKRAFLNGRIDLAQAEAVQALISSRSEEALRVLGRQLDGALSQKLHQIRERLIGVLAAIEALLNFPDEDVDDGQMQKLQSDVQIATGDVDAILSTAKVGRILRHGARVVICGKPNVGKSSLLNALLRQPRAIVTDVAGTTRDTIEEQAHIAGIPLALVDTAGILVPRDKVEEEAVRRSQQAIKSADLVLVVLDRHQALEDMDRTILAEAPLGRTVVVLNKSDLPSAFPKDSINIDLQCAVSALTETGIEALEEKIRQLLLGRATIDGQATMLVEMRHVEALLLSRSELAHAAEALSIKTPLEMVCEDIKRAVSGLDAITGRDVDSDVIDRIFAAFCIGK